MIPHLKHHVSPIPDGAIKYNCLTGDIVDAFLRSGAHAIYKDYQTHAVALCKRQCFWQYFRLHRDLSEVVRTRLLTKQPNRVYLERLDDGHYYPFDMHPEAPEGWQLAGELRASGRDKTREYGQEVDLFMESAEDSAWFEFASMKEALAATTMFWRIKNGRKFVIKRRGTTIFLTKTNDGDE
jgi:hypothetical protein